MFPRSKSPLEERLLAARQSPHFGVRLLSNLPADSRARLLQKWCTPAKPAASELRPRGLVKCARPMVSAQSESLEAFARSLSRRAG